jgi:hypothetical protein
VVAPGSAVAGVVGAASEEEVAASVGLVAEAVSVVVVPEDVSDA